MNQEKMEVGQSGLFSDIRDIISQARTLTRRSVNSLQVLSNYLIGMRIVEAEQGGQERAAYGSATLKQLSAELTREFGRGYSRSNLENMRKFYLTYASAIAPKSQTVSGISKLHHPEALSKQLSLSQISRSLSAKFPLSWSHYLFLMGVSNREDRRSL